MSKVVVQCDNINWQFCGKENENYQITRWWLNQQLQWVTLYTVTFILLMIKCDKNAHCKKKSARRHEKVDLGKLEEKCQHHQILSCVSNMHFILRCCSWDNKAITSSFSTWKTGEIIILACMRVLKSCKIATNQHKVLFLSVLYSWDTIIFQILGI